MLLEVFECIFKEGSLLVIQLLFLLDTTKVVLLHFRHEPRVVMFEPQCSRLVLLFLHHADELGFGHIVDIFNTINLGIFSIGLERLVFATPTIECSSRNTCPLYGKLHNRHHTQLLQQKFFLPLYLGYRHTN